MRHAQCFSKINFVEENSTDQRKLQYGYFFLLYTQLQKKNVGLK